VKVSGISNQRNQFKKKKLALRFQSLQTLQKKKKRNLKAIHQNEQYLKHKTEIFTAVLQTETHTSWLFLNMVLKTTE
jgi:hypothetical protein